MARGKQTLTFTTPVRRGASSPEMAADPMAAATAAGATTAPDWWTPSDFDLHEAQLFADEYDIDPAVAVRLLKDSDGNFDERWAFYKPSARLVRTPEQTVPGMSAAGQNLSDALAAGETIAIFSDYDPDGVTGSEALRLALAPYASDGQIMRGFAQASRGFGLDEQFIRDAHAAGATQLVVVDCGSGQAAEVALAQSLGMTVTVVDHHDGDAGNPAEHHLNPTLRDGCDSGNTGAQLAWKLGAAVQVAREGTTRPEHWERAMFLAGIGAYADMGRVDDPENRAFWWVPRDRDEGGELVPPGMTALAAELGEDFQVPGGQIATLAALNLAKRSTRARAETVAALMSAETAAAAAPHVAEITALYNEARPARQRMVEAGMEQINARTQQLQAAREAREARRAHLRTQLRGASDEKARASIHREIETLDAADAATPRFAVVRIDDEPEWVGYSGAVASPLSRRVSQPVVCFTYREDIEGERIYKFSLRNEARLPHKVGELIHDPAMREACVVPDRNGGAAEPSLGGHAAVVSGSCTEAHIDDVVAACESWGREKAASRSGWSVKPYTGADAYLSWRDLDEPGVRAVTPERVRRIEAQAARLAPFSARDRHRPVQVAVRGRLAGGSVDPLTGYFNGTLELTDGTTREIVLPGEPARPDGWAEWAVSLGEGREWYVRSWDDTVADAHAEAA